MQPGERGTPSRRSKSEGPHRISNGLNSDVISGAYDKNKCVPDAGKVHQKLQTITTDTNNSFKGENHTHDNHHQYLSLYVHTYYIYVCEPNTVCNPI